MTPREELAHLLRPAGGGLFVVSTGKAEQEALTRRLYGARSADEVNLRFAAALVRLTQAKVALLGVPSDVGAGFRRGANLGPQAIRAALLDQLPDWPERSAAAGIVDLGDVFVIPQLLHDEMLGEAQLAASRRALYPKLSPERAAALPVSPLSACDRILDLALTLNPRLVPIVLGGDHSVAWPLARNLAHRHGRRLGIVQLDAHTDLLAERLGVRYCFATWAYHANELIGRGGRLVQVGLRASRYDRGHWERQLDVRQLWAGECREHPAATVDTIVRHLEERGVEALYLSNDIDGTDAYFADATGTPEPDGLSREFVGELIARLGARFPFVGADLVEVAPPIASSPAALERTLETAVRYLRATLAAVLGDPSLLSAPLPVEATPNV